MRWSLALFVVLAATACGTETTSASPPTLAEWRTSVCAVFAEHEEALNAAEALGDPEDGFVAEMRATTDAMREMRNELEGLATPAERRTEAERFVELFGELAEQIEQMIPQMESAQAQIDEALESGDSESLPSSEELMGDFDQAAAARAAAEGERLTTALGLESCAGDLGGS